MYEFFQMSIDYLMNERLETRYFVLCNFDIICCFLVRRIELSSIHPIICIPDESLLTFHWKSQKSM